MKNIDKEIPFEIPDNWAWCRLTNIIKINCGYAFQSTNYTTKEKGVRVLRISDFDENGFNNKRIVYHKFEPKMELFRLEVNDIIMCMTGGTVGKSFFVNCLPEEMLVNQRVADIKANSHICQLYIALFLSSQFIKKTISEAKNSTNDNISVALIQSFLTPIPPLAEQERIVKKIKQYEPLLVRYDKLETEATELDNTIKDKLKKSILQYAIQGKLVPQDKNDEPASVLLERIRAEKKALLGKKYVDSYIYKGDDNCYYEHINGKDINITNEIPFEIPANWRWCRVKDISESYIGLTYSPSDIVSEGGAIVLRSSNIQDGKLDLTDIIRVNTTLSDKMKVNENDIIICARNGSKRLVGKSAIIDINISDLTFGAFMAICRTSLFSFVSKFLSSRCFFKQLARVSGTTTINQLTQNSFNNFYIPIPPLAEQQRIVAKIDEIFSKL